MPHAVSSQPANPCGSSSAQERTPYLIVGPRLAAMPRGRSKHPVLITRELRCLPPGSQHCEHTRINGHLASRIDGLQVVHPLLDDAAFDTEFATEPIHIGPLQCETLADPQPKAYANQGNGTEWIVQPDQEPLELVHRKTAGLPGTPRRASHCYQ